MKKVKTAVFPVGGLGTRFLPATKSTPKEMLPIANKPLVQYAFEEARDAGIEKFIFITGRNKNSLMNHFDHAYELQTVLTERKKEEALYEAKGWLPKAGHIAFVRQQEPLGLGHAIWCARDFICDEPFIVILPDEMVKSKHGENVIADMISLHEEKGGNCNVIAVGEVDKSETLKYGIIAPKNKSGNSMEIVGMVEKPKPEDAPSNLCITGRYLLEPKIFEYLEKTKKGAGNEIQLTDALTEMLKTNKAYGFQFESDRFDCGNVLGFIEANIAFALANEKIGADVMKILEKYTKK
jgi:UTP--glucose-1-phosphate uridylyltransferase